MGRQMRTRSARSVAHWWLNDKGRVTPGYSRVVRIHRDGLIAILLDTVRIALVLHELATDLG